MPRVFAGEDTFESAPLLYHARQELGTPVVKRRVKTHRNSQGYGGRHQMALGGMEDGGVTEEFVHGHLIPVKDIHWIEMVDDCQCVNLMKSWHHAAIFDVRQAADVQDELGTAAVCRQLKT